MAVQLQYMIQLICNLQENHKYPLGEKLIETIWGETLCNIIGLPLKK